MLYKYTQFGSKILFYKTLGRFSCGRIGWWASRSWRNPAGFRLLTAVFEGFWPFFMPFYDPGRGCCRVNHPKCPFFSRLDAIWRLFEPWDSQGVACVRYGDFWGDFERCLGRGRGELG